MNSIDGYKSLDKHGSLDFKETAQFSSEYVTDCDFQYNTEKTNRFENKYVYFGQANSEGLPHGTGSKFYTSEYFVGRLEQGTFQNGRMHGYC